MTFVGPIPQFKALLRAEYLYNGERGHGELEPVVVFALVSEPGHCLRFHVLTERGVQWWGVPIHALVFDAAAPTEGHPSAVQLWDCFAWDFAVYRSPLLHGMRCGARLRERTVGAECLFSIEWAHMDATRLDPSWLSMPDERKSAHVLRTDDGLLAALPNNRILWEEPSFIVRPFGEGERPDYVTNSRAWSCEVGWRTADEDAAHYEIAEAAE